MLELTVGSLIEFDARDAPAELVDAWVAEVPGLGATDAICAAPRTALGVMLRVAVEVGVPITYRDLGCAVERGA